MNIATVMKMGQLSTAVCWICILSTLASAAFADDCPPSNSSAPTRFTTKLNTREFTSYGNYKSLLCCAEGYDNISWSYHHGDKWETLPPSYFDLQTPTLSEKRQILNLKHARFEYNTMFKCELLKNGTVITKHEVKLIVQRCSQDTRKPIFTKPSAVDQTIDNYRENVTIFCNGDFGCRTGGEKAEWLVGGDDRAIANISSRYTVVSGHNPDFTELGANLTITSVQAQDTKLTFVCKLSSSKGQAITKVKIIKKEKPIVPNIVRLIGITVGGVLGGMLLLVLMTCCVTKLYGPRIKLYCSVTCPCGLESLTDEEKFDHNVLVYTADDDQEMAEQIKEQLIELGYKVFCTTDVIPGQIKISTIEREASRSAVITFLYSENLKHDDWAHIFLREFIEQGKKIIILEIGTVTYQADAVMTKAKDVTNKRITGELIVHANSIEMDNSNIDGSDEIQDDDIGCGNAIEPTKDSTMKSRINDIKLWKRLPKVKVPLEDDSNRKKVNFLCDLQNRIPKFPQQKKKGSLKSKLSNSSIGRISKGRNSSSGRPLLHSSVPNSPASPPISPSSDDVFHFEGETTPARLNGKINGTHSNASPRIAKTTREGNPVDELDHEMCAELEVQFPRQHESEDSMNEPEEHVIVNADVHLPHANPTIARNFYEHSETEIEVSRNAADSDETQLLSVYPSSGYNETRLPTIPLVDESQTINPEQTEVRNRPSLSRQTELEESRIGNRPSLSKGDSSDASDLASPVSTGLSPYKPQSVSSGFSESSFEQSGQSTRDVQPGESDSAYNSGQLEKSGQLSEGGLSLGKGDKSRPIKSKPLNANSINNHTCSTKNSDRNQTDAKLVGGVEYNLGPERNGGLKVHITGDGNRASGGSLSDIGSPESGYNTSRENSIQNHVLNQVGDEWRNG